MTDAEAIARLQMARATGDRWAIGDQYAAGTQALRDKLDATLEAKEAAAENAAWDWRDKRHPFVADEYGTACALCWRSFRGHP
jgi:hypothetical protein